MHVWNCSILGPALLLLTWCSAQEEVEICQEVELASQQQQHTSAFVKDASGNAAYVQKMALMEQRASSSPCVRWESFAHYGSSVMVKDGCQGRFNVCYTSGVPPPSVPLRDPEDTDCVTVRLLSKLREPAEKIIARGDGRGDLIVSMTLLQSFSAVSCVPGLSYDYYGHRVETKFGCKGDFRVCLDSLIMLESELPDYHRKYGSIA